jgi:hypothetical protein
VKFAQIETAGLKKLKTEITKKVTTLDSSIPVGGEDGISE